MEWGQGYLLTFFAPPTCAKAMYHTRKDRSKKPKGWVIGLMFCLLAPLTAVCQLPGLNREATRPEKDSTQEKSKPKGPRAIRTVYLLEDSALTKPARFVKIDTQYANLDMAGGWETGNNGFSQRTGTYGSAALQLGYMPWRQPGFALGIPSPSGGQVQPKDVRYYDSYTPYTQLRYVQGDGDLQVLDMDYSQGFGESLNLGLTYGSLKSRGFYENEDQAARRLSVQGHYHGPNGRYRALAYAIWNLHQISENGGVEGVALFGQGVLGTRLARLNQPTYLDADRRIRQGGYGLRQIWYMGAMDSTKIKGHGQVPVYSTHGYISHKISYLRESSLFATGQVDYFAQNYTGINRMAETVVHQAIDNELLWARYLNPPGVLRGDSQDISKPYAAQLVQAGLRVVVGRAGYWGLERLTFLPAEDLVSWGYYANTHLAGKIAKELWAKTGMYGECDLVALGSQMGDYHAMAQIHRRMGKPWVAQVWLRIDGLSPTAMQQQYASAFARWNNDFVRGHHGQAGLLLAHSKWGNLYLEAIRSQGAIYYDTASTPRQMAAPLWYGKLGLEQHLTWGALHLEHSLWVQQLAEGAPIALPPILYQGNCYLKSPLFKGATTVRLGMRLWYQGRYRAMAYSPGLGQFYMAAGNGQTGGYGWVDLYLAALVGKWEGFIKLEHLSEGLLGYPEMIMGYPMPPRALRMGLAWRFYD
jgi:hypothetical protein